MAELTILQVVPRLDTGGSEQATVEIAEALTRAGAKALVATAGGRMANAVTQAGGEVVTLPVASKNPFTMLANAKRLERLITERDVALVHARSRAPAWSALLAARRTGRPFVTTYHGAYGTFGPFKTAYNSVMGRGDRVIANSRYTANLIAERHRLKQEHIRTIYRGIDEAAFDPLVVPPGPVTKLRERWGVSPETKIVLQAARLTGLKGHRQTIEAAAALAREGALDDAVIIFAGDAPGKAAYRQELIALIARHGLDGQSAAGRPLPGHAGGLPRRACGHHAVPGAGNVRPDQRRGASHGLPGDPVGDRRPARNRRHAVAGPSPLHRLARAARRRHGTGRRDPRGARALTGGAGGDRRQGQRSGECRVRAFADANEDARRL